MEREEQTPLLNEQFSRINDARSRMMSIIPEVIDCVAGLSGFKSKYPEALAVYNAAKAEIAETETEAETLASDDWFNRLGEEVVAGDEVTHLGVTYQVIQPHTLSACWVPGQVPALYKAKADPGVEWPPIPENISAENPWMKGDKGTWKEKHYISLIDYNVWNPDAYPAGWQEQP